jgi:regulatory protein
LEGSLGRNVEDNIRPAIESGVKERAVKRTAANLAFRLLAQRSHTSRELILKLQQRGFERETIEPVVAECERLRYLDDGALAQTYRRQMTEKGYGARHVQMTMKKKGFTDRDIAASFSDYDMVADERTVAQNVLVKKVKTLGDFPDALKKKEKLYRFLSSRGFSTSTIMAVFSTTLSDT